MSRKLQLAILKQNIQVLRLNFGGLSLCTFVQFPFLFYSPVTSNFFLCCLGILAHPFRFPDVNCCRGCFLWTVLSLVLYTLNVLSICPTSTSEILIYSHMIVLCFHKCNKIRSTREREHLSKKAAPTTFNNQKHLKGWAKILKQIDDRYPYPTK